MSKISSSYISAVFVLIKKQNRVKPYTLIADCQNTADCSKRLYGWATKVLLSTFEVLPLSKSLHWFKTCQIPSAQTGYLNFIVKGVFKV